MESQVTVIWVGIDENEEFVIGHRGVGAKKGQECRRRAARGGLSMLGQGKNPMGRRISSHPTENAE